MLYSACIVHVVLPPIPVLSRLTSPTSSHAVFDIVFVQARFAEDLLHFFENRLVLRCLDQIGTRFMNVFEPTYRNALQPTQRQPAEVLSHAAHSGLWPSRSSVPLKPH
jgi:hypothetical protein